jgi:hypothetical protein
VPPWEVTDDEVTVIVGGWKSPRTYIRCLRRGDVTSAPVPRAGVIAEGEASTVAGVLIARIAGGPPPTPCPGK